MANAFDDSKNVSVIGVQYEFIHNNLLEIFNEIDNQETKNKYYNKFCDNIIENNFGNDYLDLLVYSGLIEQLQKIVCKQD